LGLIPARGGSKGIPKKNIKLLNGRPLLEYTFNTAKSAKKLSRVILSSEDPEIMELANKIGLEVLFTRPQELARDTTSSLEVIRHCLEFFEAQGEIFDAICLLQPTTPFREKNLIDSAITKF